MFDHRITSAALAGAVVALLGGQAIDALAAERGGAAAAPQPAAATALPPAQTPAPEPVVVVVPAAEQGEIDLEPIVHRLDVLAAEIAHVREVAGRPPVQQQGPTPVVQLPQPPAHLPEPVRPETQISYEWECGEDCVYVTTVYHTEGNEAGADAGDIDAVTYVCVASAKDAAADRRSTVADEPDAPADRASASPGPVPEGAVASAEGEPEAADPVESDAADTAPGAVTGDEPVADCGDVSN